MSRRHHSTGSIFEERTGYARAVAEGPWIFVSGTTGYDYADMRISEDPAEQAEQCFRNVRSAVDALGGAWEDMIRIRVYVADAVDVPAVMDVVGRHCRAVRPANTTVVSALVDPAMKVEIEVTLLRREG